MKKQYKSSMTKTNKIEKHNFSFYGISIKGYVTS